MKCGERDVFIFIFIFFGAGIYHTIKCFFLVEVLEAFVLQVFLINFLFLHKSCGIMHTHIHTSFIYIYTHIS